MTLDDIQDYVAGLVPVEDIPVDWDNTGYLSPEFNAHAAGPNFEGWPGDMPSESEAGVMVDLLGAGPDDSLIDVACGYGRHAMPLAQLYGLKVTGVDNSPGLISVARRAAAERDVDIRYEQCDARRLHWQDCFDFAVIGLNTFSMFSPDDAPAVLKGIHSSLRSAGRLFMDLDNKSFNRLYGTSDRDWYFHGGALTLQEIHYDEETSVETSRDVLFRAGSSSPEQFVAFKRIYSDREIDAVLEGNGFSIAEIYGDWGLAPLTDDSPKMIVVAVKK